MNPRDPMNRDPMNPANESFRRMMRYGFVGHRIPNIQGGLGVLYFHRPDPVNQIHDGLVVWQDGSAHGYRSTEQFTTVADAGYLLADPDPDSWHWLQTGDAVSVVNALLSLPRRNTEPSSRTWPPERRG